jgi:hypothetical protein
MTDVGHRVNGFPADTSACPSATVVAANPELQAAEYILDNVKYGVDRQYLKSGGVSDPLTTVGHYAEYHNASISHGQVATEVNAGRPVAVDITWPSGVSHVVAIAGILGDSLLILDPINGTSVIRWQNFPATYFGGATLDGFAFTKKKIRCSIFLSLCGDLLELLPCELISVERDYQIGLTIKIVAWCSRTFNSWRQIGGNASGEEGMRS